MAAEAPRLQAESQLVGVKSEQNDLKKDDHPEHITLEF